MTEKCALQTGHVEFERGGILLNHIRYLLAREGLMKELDYGKCKIQFLCSWILQNALMLHTGD